MTEKFFLAMDFAKREEVQNNALSALGLLEHEYGFDFVKSHVGLKINQHSVTGAVPQDAFRYINEGRQLGEYVIFADMKIGHGADNGKIIVDEVRGVLPNIDYITVAAQLGKKILRDYISIGKEVGTKVIAFTQHTKTPEEDIVEMYGKPLADVVFAQAKIASDAGCEATVMEAAMLNDPRIRELPIKKLVPGIRIDVADKGAQSRISSLEDVANVKRFTDYAVISSKYVDRPEMLKAFIDALK